MSGHIINIRGYKLAVEAKTGTQLHFIKEVFKKRTDEWLEKAAAEDAGLVKRMEEHRG